MRMGSVPSLRRQAGACVRRSIGNRNRNLYAIIQQHRVEAARGGGRVAVSASPVNDIDDGIDLIA
ncbi:hypothetical protein [Sphingomonas sp. SCN 67-18]|uniref:hypothetical protein n=1 Tax=uncultured Sphingomonas sp. TaxID=158754 RepID=UPI0026002850|nr:hypothetical protein [Sphingomonas sp. SCN 67-18]